MIEYWFLCIYYFRCLHLQLLEMYTVYMDANILNVYKCIHILQMFLLRCSVLCTVIRIPDIPLRRKWGFSLGVCIWRYEVILMGGNIAVGGTGWCPANTKCWPFMYLRQHNLAITGPESTQGSCLHKSSRYHKIGGFLSCCAVAKREL